MDTQFILKTARNSRLLVCDAVSDEIYGFLICQLPDESPRAFSYMYGPIFSREQFTNINNFSNLPDVEYFSIEYLSISEREIYSLPEGLLVAQTANSELETANQTTNFSNLTALAESTQNETGKAMLEEKTYLELSEADGGSHKFYELIIKDKEVTIRYGRIGDQGQAKTSSYPTPEKAKAEATKKINEKLRKGYEHAVMGVRQKRSVTRRQIVSNISTAKQAPVLWKFASGDSAFGIFINQKSCWVGNQEGKIFALSHDGQVQNQYRLPEGVKCIVADDDWLYAGCDDGNVYDLTGKIPRLAYKIANDIDIFWLDIKDGILGVSDSDGQVTTINHEDESQWSKKSKGESAWMVRCDEIGVYHGHSDGVTMYDWEDGRLIWHQKTQGSVLFGWQEEATVYAGTSAGKVFAFTKKGELEKVYDCDGAVFSCATAEDGKYVFAGDNYSSIYCFDRAGDRLWKLGTGCGSAFSMQFLNDRLYIVTTDGSLACIDASESAIKAAQEGTVPTAINIKAPKDEAALPSTTLETTSDTRQGVIVECFKEGNKLRIRVVSSGYDSSWKVQFPKDIREEGARYLVEEIRTSTRGNFYRAFGDIKKLV